MIKINLLADRKQAKAKSAPGLKTEGASGSRNLLLIGVLLLGMLFTAGWWWTLNGEIDEWRDKHLKADQELKRLESIRQKGEEYKKQKDLLARKIELITELKRKQAVPVHILDQISRSLPDFLWLESMTTNNNQINIAGRATTYNAVSNFYSNLTQSGYFKDVALGKVYEVPEGVSFSLSCKFASVGEPAVVEGGTQS